MTASIHWDTKGADKELGESEFRESVFVGSPRKDHTEVVDVEMRDGLQEGDQDVGCVVPFRYREGY